MGQGRAQAAVHKGVTEGRFLAGRFLARARGAELGGGSIQGRLGAGISTPPTPVAHPFLKRTH
eukprot:scaffold67469_cov69-Phaeocystis_antarctica.AAC.1